MKKSLALASASAMGVGMVALGGAGAAIADPVTDSCVDATDHVYTPDDLGDNWFMECIPQFGMGKVEFTISSTDPLPPEFVELTDPTVTSEYSDDAAEAADYFGVSGQPAGFVELNADGDVFTYLGKAIFPITAVAAIAWSELPAACEADETTYGNAYRVDYAPMSVTFTQTIDGVDYVVVVSFPASSVFLGLNFVGADDVQLNMGEAQCISDGNYTLFTGDSPPEFLFEEWPLLTDEATLPPFADFLSTLDLGDFTVTRIEVTEPGLADTGAEISPIALGAGAVALLGGIGLLTVSRIRKGRRDSA